MSMPSNPNAPSRPVAPAIGGGLRPAAAPAHTERRGDELMPDVGKTVYEFTGQARGGIVPGQSSTELDMGMGDRPHQSNLKSGSGLTWVLATLVIGVAGGLFWWIGGGAKTGHASMGGSEDPTGQVGPSLNAAAGATPTDAQTSTQADADKIAAENAAAEKAAAEKAAAEKAAAEKAAAEKAAAEKDRKSVV